MPAGASLKEKMDALQQVFGIPEDDVWATFPADSAEGAWCAEAASRLNTPRAAVAPLIDESAVPRRLDVTQPPTTSTQEALGRIMVRLAEVPGVGERTITLSPDTVDELDETILITLSAPTGGAALGLPSTALLTILDDDQPRLAFSPAAYNVPEGNGAAIVAVALDQSPALTVTVQYSTTGDPADYTPISGTLTFAPGQTNTTLNIPIQDDALVEATESFTVTLSNPANATLTNPTTAIVQISDDDLPVVAFTVGEYVVTESVGVFTVSVSLNQLAPQTVTVNFVTTYDTAGAGDVIQASGVLTFTVGITVQTFAVTIVNDQIAEPNKAFALRLSNPANALLGAQSEISVTIRDDDYKVYLPLIQR